MAIEQALTIINWYENLPEEEVPPEYLWEDPKGLEMWWKTVEAKREDGQGLSTSGRKDDDDDSPDAPGMAENDIARYLKQ